MDKGDRITSVNFGEVHLIVTSYRASIQRGRTACGKEIIVGADWEGSLLIPTCPKCIKAEPELCKPETIVYELAGRIKTLERDLKNENEYHAQKIQQLCENERSMKETRTEYNKLQERNDFLFDLVLKDKGAGET